MKNKGKYRSTAEHLLALHLEELNIPFIHDYRFHVKRRFLFDFAIIDKKVAIEVEGLSYKKSRHQTVTGYMRDCEKYNLAITEGWRVFRIPSLWLGLQKMFYRAYYTEFIRQLQTTLGLPIK